MTTYRDERPTYKVALVVAAATNGVIGLNGRMPWRIPSDLKTFRRLTMGRPIIMGRKTFQSIGRALEGRTNIVVTRDASFRAYDVIVVSSFQNALSLGAKVAGTDGEVMIIGGGEIYQMALPLADVVYMTEIAAEPEGDTVFPPLSPDEWVETARTVIEPDPRDDYPVSLVTYSRQPSQTSP